MGARSAAACGTMALRWLRVLCAPLRWCATVALMALAGADDDAAAGPVLAALARLEARSRARHCDDDNRDEDKAEDEADDAVT